MSAAAVLAASMVGGSAGVAQTAAVQGSEATLRWAPATGPVGGYLVSVSRNGAPAPEDTLVYANEVTLPGEPGDVIVATVRAFSEPNGPGKGRSWGPSSAPSDPIRFEREPVALAIYPLLDCTGCRRFELRDPDGAVLLAVSHPTQGIWTLLGVGSLVPGRGHALLREQSSGALLVGTMSATGMQPLASAVAPGFSGSSVSRPVDLDGDGVAEFAVHDPATGAVTIWGIEGDSLTELSRCDVQPGWRLIGFGDVDRDWQLDAWFDAQGHVVVIHLQDLEAVTSTFLGNPVPGSIPVDVADYDGDGWPDVLLRDRTTGALHAALLRGDPRSPSQQVRALASESRDAYVLPRGSRDLDGVPGAEILLQDLGTGSVDVAFPSDAVPGRRQRLVSGGPGWRLVEVQ